MFGRGENTAWKVNKQNNGTTKATQPKQSTSQAKLKKPSSNAPAATTGSKKSVQTFQEAQTKHIEAAKKLMIDYESSSDEELASDSLLDSVFKGYDGDKTELKKTQQFLENVFQSGTATCLICIATVKRSDYVIILCSRNITWRNIIQVYVNILFVFRYGPVNIVTVFFIWHASNDGQTTVRHKKESNKNLMLAITQIRVNMFQKKKKSLNGTVLNVEQTIYTMR